VKSMCTLGLSIPYAWLWVYRLFGSEQDRGCLKQVVMGGVVDKPLLRGLDRIAVARLVRDPVEHECLEVCDFR
jgi:hypothetical protein